MTNSNDIKKTTAPEDVATSRPQLVARLDSSGPPPRKQRVAGPPPRKQRVPQDNGPPPRKHRKHEKVDIEEDYGPPPEIIPRIIPSEPLIITQAKQPIGFSAPENDTPATPGTVQLSGSLGIRNPIYSSGVPSAPLLDQDEGIFILKTVAQEKFTNKSFDINSNDISKSEYDINKTLAAGRIGTIHVKEEQNSDILLSTKSNCSIDDIITFAEAIAAIATKENPAVIEQGDPEQIIELFQYMQNNTPGAIKPIITDELKIIVEAKAKDLNIDVKELGILAKSDLATEISPTTPSRGNSI